MICAQCDTKVVQRLGREHILIGDLDAIIVVVKVRGKLRQGKSADAVVFRLVDVQFVFHADPMGLTHLPIDTPKKPVHFHWRKNCGLKEARRKIRHNGLNLLLLFRVGIQKECEAPFHDWSAQVDLVASHGNINEIGCRASFRNGRQTFSD